MGYAEIAGNASHRFALIHHAEHIVTCHAYLMTNEIHFSYCKLLISTAAHTGNAGKPEEKTNIKILSPFARFLMHAFESKAIIVNCQIEFK